MKWIYYIDYANQVIGQGTVLTIVLTITLFCYDLLTYCFPSRSMSRSDIHKLIPDYLRDCSKRSVIDTMPTKQEPQVHYLR